MCVRGGEEGHGSFFLFSFIKKKKVTIIFLFFFPPVLGTGWI